MDGDLRPGWRSRHGFMFSGEADKTAAKRLLREIADTTRRLKDYSEPIACLKPEAVEALRQIARGEKLAERMVNGLSLSPVAWRRS